MGAQASHKPSSVLPEPRDPESGDHLSRAAVSRRLERPYPKDSDEQPLDAARASRLPMWSCSRWGLPRPSDHAAAGELVPHHFTLTGGCRRYVSVALSLGSPPLGVTQHPALRSSDFPRTDPSARDRPACLDARVYSEIGQVVNASHLNRSSSGRAGVLPRSNCDGQRYRVTDTRIRGDRLRVTPEGTGKKPCSTGFQRATHLGSCTKVERAATV
jgi:hypothetical protein